MECFAGLAAGGFAAKAQPLFDEQTNTSSNLGTLYDTVYYCRGSLSGFALSYLDI